MGTTRWERLAALVVGVALLVACASRRVAVSPVAVQVTIADAVFEARAREGLEPSTRILSEAHRVAPDDVEVRWRLVRSFIAEGLAAEDDRARLGSLASARLVAVECLDGRTSFATRLDRYGWVDALATVGPDQGPCVAWGALAWARWLVEMGGDAAAVDVPAVRALVERARAIGGADHSVVVDWAEGLLLGAGPPEINDRARAGALLDSVARALPSAAQPRVDLAVLVALPSGDDARVVGTRQALTLAPDPTPEGAEATRRFLALSP